MMDGIDPHPSPGSVDRWLETSNGTPVAAFKLSSSSAPFVPHGALKESGSMFAQSLPGVPAFIPFVELGGYLDLFKSCVKDRHFSPRLLQRVVKQSLQSLQIRDPSTVPMALKPSALDVRAMHASCPAMFASGANVLALSVHPLRPQAMTAFHVAFCSDCGPAGCLLPECYWYSMARTLTHGWEPPLTGVPQHVFPYEGNYSNVAKFPGAVGKAVQKWVDRGTVLPMPNDTPGHLSALNCVLKNSDKNNALGQTKIAIVDQASLSKANSILAARSLPEIKGRAVADLTGSGVNACVLRAPYTNASVHDALALVTPHCWMATSDVEQFYAEFPVSTWLSYFMAFVLAGQLYLAVRILFGFSPAPFFCATFAAEFKVWFAGHGIATAHMTDDWFFAEQTRQHLLDQRKLAVTILMACGFKISFDKDQDGQVVLFLGALIDSVRMTVSFSRENAQGYLLVLQAFKEKLIHNISALCPTTINSVAGKLNDYAQFVQAGRSHVGSCWRFSRSFPTLEAAERSLLLEDIEFWQRLLTDWSNGVPSNVFPILNAKVFDGDPSMIWCVQTDASGALTEGYGGVEGSLFDPDPHFFSCAWNGGRRTSASMGWEFCALLLYLLHRCKRRNSLILWFTDSLSGAYSLNKGYCSSPECLVILREILAVCDSRNLWVVGCWTSRDLIQVSDYASHLASYLNRDFVSCRISELTSEAYRSPAGTSASTLCQDGAEIPGVLREEVVAVIPGAGSNTGVVPLHVCPEESWLCQVARNHRELPAELQCALSPQVARFNRPGPPARRRERASLPGYSSNQPEATLDPAPPSSHIAPPRLFGQRPYPGSDAMDGPRWIAAARRDGTPAQSEAHHLGTSPTTFLPPARSYKDASQGRPNFSGLQASPGPLCSSCPSSAL